MVVRRLQPKIARHLILMPFTDFTSLTSTLFSVEEGIARGLWPDSSPNNPKGKEPLVGRVQMSIQFLLQDKGSPNVVEQLHGLLRHIHLTLDIITHSQFHHDHFFIGSHHATP